VPKLAREGTFYSLYNRATFRHLPPLESAVELLLKYFFSRTDLVAFAPPWDATACPAIGGEGLRHLLRAHLGGEKVRVPWKTRRTEGLTRQPGRFRIGSYGPAPDGTTKWVVADFDGGDHSEPLADPTAVALTAYHRFWRAGIPSYLERSRSGAGWHLWTLFRRPVQAAKARRLVCALLPDDALLIDGSLADAHAGIEVFPKRNDLTGCSVGHQMWLPWYCGASRGGNVFYRPCDGRLIAYVPEDFETATEEAVDAVLGKEGGA
jgi:hypothetical protein